MSPQEAARLVGLTGIPALEAEMRDRLAAKNTDIDTLRAEIERLRIALRAVRATTCPKWRAQIIRDALREGGAT